MKLLVRVLAMLVVFAGLTAASISSTPATMANNHFGAAVSGAGPMMPGPPCPTCNPSGPGGLHTR